MGFEEGFAQSTVRIVAETGKMVLEMMEYLLRLSRNEIEFRQYEKSYADILRHPDDYAVFQVTGDVKNAEELKERLITAGMDSNQLITFNADDQLICVHNSFLHGHDKEVFLAYLEAAKNITFDEHDADTSHKEYRIQYTVDNYGNFVSKGGAETVYKYNEYGDYVDSNGIVHLNDETLIGKDVREQTLIASGKKFAQDNQGKIFVKTPTGNFINTRYVNLETGHYDDFNVTETRTSVGDLRRENSSFTYGTVKRDVLRDEYRDTTTYERVLGGFTDKSNPNGFIPERNEHGDYYDPISNKIVVNMYDMQDRYGSAEYDHVYAKRKAEVMASAEEQLTRHQDEIYRMDADGNMHSGQSMDFSAICDEYGTCVVNGQEIQPTWYKKLHSRDFEHETDREEDYEREHSDETAEETEDEVEAAEEEKEEEPEDEVEQNDQEAPKDNTKKEKKKSKTREDAHEGYTQDKYQEESLAQEEYKAEEYSLDKRATEGYSSNKSEQTGYTQAEYKSENHHASEIQIEDASYEYEPTSLHAAEGTISDAIIGAGAAAAIATGESIHANATAATISDRVSNNPFYDYKPNGAELPRDTHHDESSNVANYNDYAADRNKASYGATASTASSEHQSVGTYKENRDALSRDDALSRAVIPPTNTLESGIENEGYNSRPSINDALAEATAANYSSPQIGRSSEQQRVYTSDQFNNLSGRKTTSGYAQTQQQNTLPNSYSAGIGSREANKRDSAYASRNIGFVPNNERTVNTANIGTRKENQAAIHATKARLGSAAGTAELLVGRDTSIQTNFLTQRKIFGADEIRVAGQNKIKRPSAEGFDDAVAGMYRGLTNSAMRSDPSSRGLATMADGYRVVKNLNALRNRRTADVLSDMSMKKMITLSGSKDLTHINRYMLDNKEKAFIFPTKINGREITHGELRKSFERQQDKLISALQREGYIQRGMLKDSKGAARRIFGNNYTKDQQKFLNEITKQHLAVQRFRTSYKQASKQLLRLSTSIGSHNDETMNAIHKGIHTVQTSQKAANFARKAIGRNVNNVRSYITLNGRYTRHEAAFDNLRNKAVNKLGAQSEEYAAKAASFQTKPKAERRNLNKRATQEYDNLRKAKKQQDWLNSHRAKFEARQKQIATIQNKLNKVNNIPNDLARKGLQRAERTRPGRIVKRGINKVQNANNAMRVFEKKAADKLKNTAVGRFLAQEKAFLAKVRRAADAALHGLKMFVIKFIGIYIGTAILLTLLLAFALLPTVNSLSMWVNDQLNMVDQASSLSSISGTVYNELRYMEIEWGSEIRSYGTSKNKISIASATNGEHDDDTKNGVVNGGIYYTDQKLTAEEYFNSVAGAQDWLGAYAQTSTDHGLQGPTPFEGAELENYKVITDIDGGNVLEIEGKPMEGWTSNAKEVIAMSTTFYGQCVEEATTEMHEEVSSWQDVWTNITNALHKFGTWLEAVNFPVLGWVAGGTDWSYTGMYRAYAYPLALASHQEDFYLSTYIYPTKWTAPELTEDGNTTEGFDDEDAGNNVESASHEKSEGHEDSRYDTSQEVKKANDGDITLSGNYNATYAMDGDTEAQHGSVGIGKNGGSGKTDTENRVSKSLWGKLGDDDYDGFETCADALGNTKDKDIYNGYGCMARYKFSQQWLGSFGTDIEGNLTNEEASGINKLHYGEADEWNQTEENHYEGKDEKNNNVEYSVMGQDVSADVSPYYTKEDEKRQYNEDSCLVSPVKMTEVGWCCWEQVNDGGSDITYRVPSPQLDHIEWTYESYRQQMLFEDEGSYGVEKIVTTDTGFEVYTFKRTFEEQEDGSIVEVFDQPTAIYRWEFKHKCTGEHVGVYCGGHAQLRTRGKVYGLSKEQMATGDSDTDEKSSYDPKNIDPDAQEEESKLYSDAVDVRGNAITTFDEYLETMGEPEDGTAGITEDDEDYVKDARDLYDIDMLITRKKSIYPQKEATGVKAAIVWGLQKYVEAELTPWVQWTFSDAETQDIPSESTTNTEPWKGWTLTNMGQVAAMLGENWHDQYQVVDTQTIVGGQDGTSDSSSMNSLDTDMANNVLAQLGWNDIANSIDTGDPDAITRLKADHEKNGYAEVNGTILSISEEVELINQLRHLKYAMDLVGNVSYSQSDHTYLYGNLSGHQTDCSGFVSNIWRDALGLTGSTGALTTTGLYNAAEAAGALKTYTGAGTAGIEPGDIILKDPNSGDSAHALIYVGELDETKLYMDRTTTDENGNYDYSAQTASFNSKEKSGETKVYAIDCSTMTITTETYAANQPNTLAKVLAGDTFLNLLGTKNYEPQTETEVTVPNDVTGSVTSTVKTAGVPKVRSGNVRFSPKSYLQSGATEDHEIYYIDMDQLAKANGVYSQTSDGTLTSIYGTFWYDYDGYKMTASEDEKQDDNSSYNTKVDFDNPFMSSTSDFWKRESVEGLTDAVRETVLIYGNANKPNKTPNKLETDGDKDEAEGNYYANNAEGLDIDENFDWEEYANQLPDSDFKNEILQKIKEMGSSAWAQYYASNYMKYVTTSDGKTYMYEVQSSAGPYGGANTGDSANSIGRRGCYYYALAAALSAKSGHAYTVQDLISASGGSLKWNGNKLSMGGMNSVGGNTNTASAGAADVGLTGVHHAGTTVSLNAINQGLKEGKVYCVWSTNQTDPSYTLHYSGGAGMHWTAIVGRTESGNYIVLGNTSGQYEISPSDMPKSFASYAEIY